MADITITPQEFTYTMFDGGEIASIAEKLAAEVGLGDVAIEIEIDETTPLGRLRVDSFDPVRLHIEGGAMEDPTEPRHLSRRLAADVIGRLLLRASDRRSGSFDDAPADADLDLPQQVAWDSYCVGRLARLGYEVQEPRRRYIFRTRHGFTDVADGVFERLWAADGLSWADIAAACAETEKVRQPA